jgi:hypothetical protein
LQLLLPLVGLVVLEVYFVAALLVVLMVAEVEAMVLLVANLLLAHSLQHPVQMEAQRKQALL